MHHREQEFAPQRTQRTQRRERKKATHSNVPQGWLNLLFGNTFFWIFSALSTPSTGCCGESLLVRKQEKLLEMRRAKNGRVLISAHRGAKGYAPENTMAAFQRANELKADIIEFDVHLSRDNRCVVIHDETLERTSNGSGLVRAHSWAELHQLDVGSWFDTLNDSLRTERELNGVRPPRGWIGTEYVALPIPAGRFAGTKMPLLEEVLEWGKAVGMALSVEIKSPWPFYYGADFYPGLVEQLVELIERHGDPQKVMLHSFDHRACLRVKELNPELGTAISIGGALYVDLPGLLRVARAEGVAIGSNYVYPELLEEIHAANGYLFGWGLGEDPINEAAGLCQLVKWGVDFVSGGFPDLLRQVVENC